MEALKFVEDSTATRTVPQERPRTPPRMRKKARSLSPMEAESVAESKELGIPNGERIPLMLLASIVSVHFSHVSSLFL
jgi:hypothetical protein